MRQTTPSGTLLVTLLLLSAWAGAAEPPTAVSPGDASKLVLIGDACPTFSWGAVVDADSYELVVYQVGDEGEMAKVVVRQRITGTANGWTPSLDGCLEHGRRYAWSIRGWRGQDATDWSSPSLFEVAAGPSETEFEAAVEVVLGYLMARENGPAVPAGRNDSSETPAPGHSLAPLAPPPGTQMSVDGNVDATSFSGDGSALTALDPSNLSTGTAGIDISGTAATASNLGCTDCVSEAELDFDTATQTEMTAHAGDTSAHHTPPTGLPPTGAAGGDLTGTFPNPGVAEAIARDSEVTASIATHGGTPDAHREHATLEESAEIDSDIGVHAGLPNIHHTPTVDTDTVLSEGQVETFITNGPLDGTNFTDLNGSNVSTGTVAEPRIADEIARDAEVFPPGGGALRLIQCASANGWRYYDLGDGTVLDCNTGLIWLKDASCADLAGTDASGRGTWATAQAAAAALADGTCGLTDGSVAGDWRQPTISEFCSAGAITQTCPAGNASDSLIDSSLGAAPHVVNAAGNGLWTEADTFVGVASYPYWSATEVDAIDAWVVNLNVGFVGNSSKGAFFLVWPVRAGQ